MQRFVVAYASQAGQTEKIAHHVARTLENAGQIARLIDIGSEDDISDVGECDAAIIAGPMRMGVHGPALAAFVREHRQMLNAVPSAFLSVSLSAASPDPRERHEAEDRAILFEEETGWRPDHTRIVGGAVHDRAHNPIIRFILHAILKRKGVALDPSGNTEFTDWPALDRFVLAFMRDVAASGQKKASAG